MGQAQLRLQQLKKQIRIEVRNAQYSLAQSKAPWSLPPNHREGAGARRGIELPDADGPPRSGRSRVGPGSGDDGISESEDRIEP